MNAFRQYAQNSANAEKTRPVSSKRIVTYLQMSVALVFSAVFECFIMNAGQRFSDSEWSRILTAGGLVVFGGSLWCCLVLQLDLC